jgi:hypothetical protein
MKTILNIGQQELTWAQPRKHKREYELRAGTEVVATLRWQNRHSQVAAGEAAQGRWTFERLGFLHPHVEARQDQSDLELARFQPHWRGGGTLEFPDGRRFDLRPTSFWNAEWAWTTTNNDLLLRITRESRRVQHKGYVDLLPTASDIPELSLLILLGWYLVLLTADDATTATMAASVAATAAVG